MPTAISLPVIQIGLGILCLFIGMIYLAALFIGRRKEFFHPRPSATPASGGQIAFGHPRPTTGGQAAGDKQPSATFATPQAGDKQAPKDACGFWGTNSHQKR